MDFASCATLIEKLYLLLCVILFLTSTVSGLVVFSNEDNKASKALDLLELLGAFSVFFSGQQLSEKGKVWRPVFVGSFVCFVGLVCVGFFLDFC